MIRWGINRREDTGDMTSMGKLSAVASHTPTDEVPDVEELTLDVEDAPPARSSAELTLVKGETLLTGIEDEEYRAVVARLLEPLDRSLVKQRDGYGEDENGRTKKLNYLEWHTVTKQLNRIFGFGTWSTEVVEVKDYFDPAANDGIPRAVRVTKRLSVNSPFFIQQTFIGYSAVRARGGKYTWAGYEMAVGDAEAAAFKRAAAQFGDQFGLGLYEKEETATAAPTGATANPSSASREASTSSSKPVCEECGREITDWTNNSGRTYTVDQLVSYSKRDCDGHVLCGQHKRTYQQEHQGRA